MILVTGGTGLVGSHMLLYLLKKGYEVRAIKRAEADLERVRKVFSCYDGRDAALMEKIEWCEGDICDYHAVESAMENVDRVFHCAGLVSFSSKDQQRLKDINVDGTTNVVNAALSMGVKKICHVSSVAALEAGGDDFLINEDHVTKNRKNKEGYALSKWLGEREVWRGQEEGLQTVIVNPSIILGPAFWHSGSSAIFHKTRKGVPYYTDIYVGLVDVRDVVSIMETLMFSNISGERFILNGANIRVKAVGETLNEMVGYEGSYRLITKPLATFFAFIDLIVSKLTFSKRRIPAEMLEMAFTDHKYSNDKVTKMLGVNFIDPKESLRFFFGIFRKTV